MQIKYYETAWRDISNSPGWFGKLCLLALVNFIPVFGQIVTFGYLYGWAREIAWGVHAPMPAKLICNEDGKFWRRGWFALLITIVFAILPSIVVFVGYGLQGAGMAALYDQGAKSISAMTGAGTFIYYLGLAFGWFMSILAWIGCMRSTIYDRLSSGFQFGKIWKMFRRDTGGILRIFGMELLVSFILGIVLGILITILLVIFMMVGAAGLVGAGYTANSFAHMTSDQAAQMAVTFFAASGIVGLLCLIVACFACFLVTSFIYMLVFRAVGYWTSQFDVPRWRGQDDPMPFELDPQPQAANQVQPPLYYDGSQGQAGYPSQTQGQYQAPSAQAQPFVPFGSAAVDQQPVQQAPAEPFVEPLAEPFSAEQALPEAEAEEGAVTAQLDETRTDD